MKTEMLELFKVDKDSRLLIRSTVMAFCKSNHWMAKVHMHPYRKYGLNTYCSNCKELLLKLPYYHCSECRYDLCLDCGMRCLPVALSRVHGTLQEGLERFRVELPNLKLVASMDQAVMQ